METNNDLTGRLVLLPGGEMVRIETVYSDGFAAVRRTRGPLRGIKAICAISKLEPFDSQAAPKAKSPNDKRRMLGSTAF